MKTNGAFNKITIDSAKLPRSKFGLAHDVNTTASIGDTQPLACRLLIPKSKTTLSMRHLVRLAPMVVPTFGRLKAKCWSHFVGMSDLLPRSVPAMLAKAPIAKSDPNTGVYVPSELPYMPLCDVSALALFGASCTVYFHDPYSTEVADSNLTRWRSYDSGSTAQAKTDFASYVGSYLNYGTESALDNYTGGFVDLRLFGSQFGSTAKWIPFNASGATSSAQCIARMLYTSSSTALETSWEPVELSTADYVIRSSFTQNGRSYEVAYAFRLSAFGKRIRKILLGLGYQINFAVAGDISVLPIFAYYKAYFDTFGLTLYNNWESCSAAYLLNCWDNGLVTPMAIGNNYFYNFVHSLGTTFVTETQDYISAHQASDVVAPSGTNGEKTRGFLNNIVLDTTGQSNGVSGISQIAPSVPVSPVSSYTGHVYINRTNHTEVDAKLLQTLYKWTNRQTIAGRRIKELLEAGGYGDYVKNCKSNFIGYEELDIDVTDINATADSTNSVTGHNSTVGEYTGKGVGVTKGDAKTIAFENDEFGYWVTLFAICPESGWCQGLDQTLLAYDADHLYNADFDGKGMELQPKTVVIGGSDWCLRASDSAAFTSSFGVVPRHSRYKVAHNIMNGDFSLRGVRDSYQPFSLDKILNFGNRDAELEDASNFRYAVQKYLTIADVPVAGNPWRYLNRYQWLANFERIFTMFESNTELFNKLVRDIHNLSGFELLYNMYDHFICMNVLDMVTYAPMLPIADSYGTTDDNDGHGDKTFTKA